MVFYTRLPVIAGKIVFWPQSVAWLGARGVATLMKQLMNKLTWTALALAWCWSAVAVAVPVTGMYSATTLVADQSTDARKEAMPAMLQQVVGRVVGEPDPQKLLQRWPDLASSLERADTYLEQFLYQRLAGQGGQLRLRVEFDQLAVDKLVRRLAMPQWGSDRPEVLTVLAWEAGGRREVLASSPSSLLAADLLAEVEQVAQQSGLPIALPLMDIQDQRDLPAAEVRAGFYDQALNVAARYGADAVLVGRLKIAGGNVLAERKADVKWSLLQRNQPEQSTENYGSLREGLEAGLWMATRSLAQRYAISGSDAASDALGATTPIVTLNVLGIRDFEALKSVEKHLQSRSVVSKAQLTQMREVDGQVLAVFQIGLKGDVNKFTQALRVGRLLQPTASALSDDGSAPLESDQADLPWYRMSR